MLARWAGRNFTVALRIQRSPPGPPSEIYNRLRPCLAIWTQRMHQLLLTAHHLAAKLLRIDRKRDAARF